MSKSNYNENSAFNKWWKENIEELRIKWAENGADREMDFDEEAEVDKEWEDYKNTH